MTKSVCRGSISTFRAVCRPALIAVAGVAILLSGCSQGASQSEGPQAKKVATTTRAQKDIQAKLAADVKKLKDDAAKAAEAKTAATNAAKASKAKTSITWCNKQVSAGPDTTCAFANKVFKGMVVARWNRRTSVSHPFDVYSPTAGVSYKMTCKLGATIVCRGGKDAVVYLEGSNPGENQYDNW